RKASKHLVTLVHWIQTTPVKDAITPRSGSLTLLPCQGCGAGQLHITNFKDRKNSTECRVTVDSLRIIIISLKIRNVHKSFDKKLTFKYSAVTIAAQLKQFLQPSSYRMGDDSSTDSAPESSDQASSSSLNPDFTIFKDRNVQDMLKDISQSLPSLPIYNIYTDGSLSNPRSDFMTMGIGWTIYNTNMSELTSFSASLI